jgi:hypothetical protein
VGAGLREENASKKRLFTPLRASVFLAKGGGARYQVPAFSGSCRRTTWSAAIAQLVEHVIRNDGVTGSSPVCGTIPLARSKVLFVTFHEFVVRLRRR